jgi:hypothetical protein
MPKIKLPASDTKKLRDFLKELKDQNGKKITQENHLYLWLIQLKEKG